MAGIFISYRRDDQPGFVGRLSDALIAAYAPEKVFRDVDDIHPGDDFVAELTHQLRNVDAMLVVIGPDWLATNSNGSRRGRPPAKSWRPRVRRGGRKRKLAP